MKIRMGFVSNSSSSSFICDITGQIESGMDICLNDAEMSMCVNGHTFLNEYLLFDLKNAPDNVKIKLVAEEMVPLDHDIKHEDYTIQQNLRKEDQAKKIDIYIKEHTKEEMLASFENGVFNEEISYGYNVPVEMCPLCQFEEISNNDSKRYMLKLLKLTEKELKETIKNEFKDFNDFQRYLTIKE